MNNKEVDKLLKQANKERLFGDPAKSIAILHQLVNAFPKEIKYLELLASSYYELREYELALEYCNKIQELDLQNKEQLELRGMIANEKGDKELAIDYYKQALALDSHFNDCRMKLIEIYKEQKDYEKIESESKFILEDQKGYLEKYEVKKRNLLDWYYLVNNYLWTALVAQKKYEEAVNAILIYKEYLQPATQDIYAFSEEDDKLYKLYHLLKDKEKIEAYKTRWLEFYKVPPGRVTGMEKDADQGYILEMNPENYGFDQYGYIQ